MPKRLWDDGLGWSLAGARLEQADDFLEDPIVDRHTFVCLGHNQSDKAVDLLIGCALFD